MRKNNLIALGCVALLLPTLSAAEPYVGASVGQIGDIHADDETTYELTAGYRLSENFGVELTYHDMGEGTDSVGDRLSLDALSLSAVAFIPLSDQVELFASIGMFDWDGELREPGGVTYSSSDKDVVYSVGSSFLISEGVKANLQYRTFDFEEDDAGQISVGLTVAF